MVTLVGLHFVLSAAERDLQRGHDGHDLVKTCGGQSHGDAGGGGHSQAQRPASDGYRIGETGELHRTSPSQQGTHHLFLLQILSVVQLRLSQGVH